MINKEGIFINVWVIYNKVLVVIYVSVFKCYIYYRSYGGDLNNKFFLFQIYNQNFLYVFLEFLIRLLNNYFMILILIISVLSEEIEYEFMFGQENREKENIFF